MLISGKWNLQGQKKKSANPGRVLSPSIHVGAWMALICILNLRLTLGKPMERGFYRPLSGLSGGLAGLPSTSKKRGEVPWLRRSFWRTWVPKSILASQKRFHMKKKTPNWTSKNMQQNKKIKETRLFKGKMKTQPLKYNKGEKQM